MKLTEKILKGKIDTSRPTIFFDMDDTMLKASLDPERGRDMDPRLSLVRFDYADKMRLCQVRPSTVPTLKWAQEQGYQLAVITSGDTGLQIQTLKEVGLLDFFVAVIGLYELEGKIPTPKAWVLVDDHELWMNGAHEKLHRLGLRVYASYREIEGVEYPDKCKAKEVEEIAELVENFYVKCRGWAPDAKAEVVDEYPLTALTESIRMKLEAQESGR